MVAYGRGARRVATALAALCLWPAAAQAQDPQLVLGIDPPDTNDFSCKPAPAHPYPVILVHGTFADMTVSWNLIAPQLKRDGFCLFALDYGNRATGPYDESADQIAAFTRRVLGATGAKKVAFVGHSQGGSVTRYAMRFRDLLDVTDELVGLAPSSHGTDQPLAGPLGLTICPACGEQVTGSPTMLKLNDHDEAPGPASYTVLATKYDSVVVPYQSQALKGSGAVTNVVLQDKCPGDFFEHVGIIYDTVALQWLRNALLRPGPANPAFQPDCSGNTLGHDPGTGAPSPNTSAPRLVLRAGRLTVRGRSLRVPVRCTGPDGLVCAGQVVVRSGSRVVARRTVRIKTGTSRNLVLQVLRKQLARVRRAHRLRVTARTSGGAPQTVRTYAVSDGG
jgi:triacylglycerol lipase